MIFVQKRRQQHFTHFKLKGMLINWKRLDRDEYLNFRKKLLKEKGSDDQRKFLEDVRDGEAFLKRMEKIKQVGTQLAETLDVPLCEGQFNNSPPNTEECIYEKWKGLTPEIASSADFWAYLSLEHIRKGKIESSFLARNNNAFQTGIERIDRVLSESESRSKTESETESGSKKSDPVDDCVRSVLRQMGGLPEVRGRRSVIVDCPFSRAWWRQRLIKRASDRSGISQRNLGQAIRESKSHWEKFAAVMISRNPVFGFDHVQDALLVALALPFEDSDQPFPKLPAKRIWDICQRICILSGSRELGIFTYEEVLKLIKPIVKRARK